MITNLTVRYHQITSTKWLFDDTVPSNKKLSDGKILSNTPKNGREGQDGQEGAEGGKLSS